MFFREIGNALGFYYEADISYQSTGYMGMAHILVGIKLFVGLADTIIIQRRDEVYHRELDYEGIPFRCGKCHFYGHLAKEWSRNVKSRIWVRKDQGVLQSDHPPSPLTRYQSPTTSDTEKAKASQAISKARKPPASPFDPIDLLGNSIPSSTSADLLKVEDLCLILSRNSISKSVSVPGIDFLSSLYGLMGPQPTPLIPLAKQIDINHAANIPPLPFHSLLPRDFPPLPFHSMLPRDFPSLPLSFALRLLPNITFVSNLIALSPKIWALTMALDPIRKKGKKLLTEAENISSL